MLYVTKKPRHADDLTERRKMGGAGAWLVYEVSDDEVSLRMREAEEDPGVMITFDELVAGLRNRGA